MPRAIGAVVSSRLASMAELSTVLSVEDVYMLLEVISVDAYNQEVINHADRD